MYYVYKITNKINGKIYIGKTKNPKERWHKHRQIAKNTNQNKPLYNNIRKYGVDNFSFEILETFDSESNSFDGERKWINQYKSNDLTIGMNLTNGGEGPSGMKHTNETKERLRKTSTGYKHTEETKNFLRQIHRGKKT